MSGEVGLLFSLDPQKALSPSEKLRLPDTDQCFSNFLKPCSEMRNRYSVIQHTQTTHTHNRNRFSWNSACPDCVQGALIQFSCVLVFPRNMLVYLTYFHDCGAHGSWLVCRYWPKWSRRILPALTFSGDFSVRLYEQLKYVVISFKFWRTKESFY